MHFTKQDILTLAKLLGKLGVKDSSFINLDEVEDSTYIPVVSDKTNMKISAKKLAKYVQSLDYPIKVNGATATFLKTVLAEIVDRISVLERGGNNNNNNNDQDNPGGDQPEPETPETPHYEFTGCDAELVSYRYEVTSETIYTNVKQVLNYIIGCINALNENVVSAKTDDITNILKS